MSEQDEVSARLARLMSEQTASIARERRAEKCPARLGSLNHARRSARSARCQPWNFKPANHRSRYLLLKHVVKRKSKNVVYSEFS